MNKALFLPWHIGLADTQIIANDMWYSGSLEALARDQYNNSDFYTVLRGGKRKGAHVTVDFISTLRDLIFIVVYGLCDGSEEYMYDSRNY